MDQVKRLDSRSAAAHTFPGQGCALLAAASRRKTSCATRAPCDIVWSTQSGLLQFTCRGHFGEITELKAERKALAAKHAGEEEEEAAPSPELVALDTKIDELTETRKELAGSNFRDKHYQVGSVILGLGTSFAIEGPVNTFLRAQKLFPGPHLYAGAGVVVAWALAASTVPLMSKGKDWARSAHIAFNLLAFGLFTWQLPTGWEITQKVIKFTQWP